MADQLPDFVMIGDQILDVAVAEEHTFEADVTDYPVEDGSSITDNIRIKPIKVNITGIVSNYAFGIGATAVKNTGNLNPADSAYRYLAGLRQNRTVFTVITSLDRYPNMVVTSLRVPRDPGSATFLRFECQMQQIDFVKNEKTVPTIPTGTPPSSVTRPPKDQDVRPIQVLRIDYNTFGYYWFDNAIGGWRNAAQVGRGGIWLAERGLPFGVSLNSYANNPSDNYWKQQIAITKKSKGVLDPTSPNPYDPFSKANMLKIGHVYDAKDVRTVNARIVSSRDFDLALQNKAFGSDLPVTAPTAAPLDQAWYDPNFD